MAGDTGYDVRDIKDIKSDNLTHVENVAHDFSRNVNAK